MTFAELEACVAGFNKANGGASGVRNPKNWTDADMDEAEELFDQAMARNAARGVTHGD